MPARPDDYPRPDAESARRIRVRVLSDGTIVATHAGMAGVGRTREEALYDLARKLGYNKAR